MSHKEEKRIWLVCSPQVCDIEEHGLASAWSLTRASYYSLTEQVGRLFSRATNAILGAPPSSLIRSSSLPESLASKSFNTRI